MQFKIFITALLFLFTNISLSAVNSSDSIVSCPLQPQPVTGWQLVNANCGFPTDHTFVYIRVRNFCNYSEKFYLLCCYKNKSLVRIVPKNMNVEILNEKIWQVLTYKSKITTGQIEEQKCDPLINQLAFANCQVKLSIPKSQEFKHYSLVELMTLGKKVYKENCII